MTIRAWVLVVVLASTTGITAADIAAFGCQLQYKRPRVHLTMSASSITVVSADDHQTPLFSDFLPEAGISVVLGRNGDRTGFLEVRSAAYPFFSCSTPLGGIPLRHGFILNAPGGGHEFLYMTISDDGNDKIRIIGPLGSQQAKERPISAGAVIPFSRAAIRGATVQQDLATAFALNLSNDKKGFELHWGKGVFKTDLPIPRFIAMAADNESLAMPITFGAQSQSFTFFWLHMKDGRRMILAEGKSEGSSRAYVFEPPFTPGGGLRLIRSWVYFQDGKIGDTPPAQAARMKFTHRLWRPTDDKRLEFQATGDFELLDISEGNNPEALVRIGDKLMTGRFDPEKQGPIPTKAVEAKDVSASFHWGCFTR